MIDGEETKDLSDRSRPGPPRSTTAEENQLMVDLTTEEMDATSETVQQELEKERCYQQSNNSTTAP